MACRVTIGYSERGVQCWLMLRGAWACPPETQHSCNLTKDSTLTLDKDDDAIMILRYFEMLAAMPSSVGE